MAKREARYFDADGGLLKGSPAFYSESQWRRLFPGQPPPRKIGFYYVAVWHGRPQAATPAHRMVLFDPHGSGHACSARCATAKGPNCECSCGGANHGKAR